MRSDRPFSVAAYFLQFFVCQLIILALKTIYTKLRHNTGSSLRFLQKSKESRSAINAGKSSAGCWEDATARILINTGSFVCGIELFRQLFPFFSFFLFYYTRYLSFCSGKIFTVFIFFFLFLKKIKKLGKKRLNRHSVSRFPFKYIFYLYSAFIRFFNAYAYPVIAQTINRYRLFSSSGSIHPYTASAAPPLPQTTPTPARPC